MKTYYYKVVEPINDYGLNLKIGDLITENQLLAIPAYYRDKVVLLSSPITK